MKIFRFKLQHNFLKQNNSLSIILLFGLLKFLIHLITLNKFGLHADELYYIELSRNFAWGYLDISPFITWIAGFVAYFGNSIIVWRILPCLFSAFTVMLTGGIAHILGGRNLAICIACSAVICSPAILATSYLLQPAVFDQFFWTLLSYSFLAYQKHRQPKYIFLGALAFSFGMLNKYTILFYFCFLVLGYFIYERKYKNGNWKKMLIALVLSLSILLPNILWQVHHRFPILHYSAIVSEKNLNIDIGDYLLQLFFFNGAGVAIWTAGLMFLLIKKQKTVFELIFAGSLLLLFLALSLLKGKLYYGLGIFPVFFAYGGYCWEMMFTNKGIIPKAFFFVALYGFTLLSLPIIIPIFPVDITRGNISKMVSITGFRRPLRWESKHIGTLPQYFADMQHWHGFTAKMHTLASAWNDKHMLIYTQDYAVAAALKYYCEDLDAHVISASNSFLLDAPESVQNKNIIFLSLGQLDFAERYAQNVTLAGVLKVENSHLQNVHVYIFCQTNEKFQRKFIQEKKAFYPGYNTL